MCINTGFVTCYLLFQTITYTEVRELSVMYPWMLNIEHPVYYRMGLTMPLTVDTLYRHSKDNMQMYLFVHFDSTVENFHTLCLIVQY
jgi:hypothetical protein